MARADLEWIHLTDFSPGIHSRVGGTGFSAASPTAPPNGIASPTNTYRCHSLDNGALAPLWYQDYTLNYDALTDGALGSGREYQITGFYVAQPVAVANSPREHEFFFGIEWIDGTNRKWELRRYRVFDTTWDTILNSISSVILPTTDQFQNTHFITTRSNQAAPTSPGTPVVIAAMSAPGPVNPKKIYSFPNDSAASVTATELLFDNTLSASILVGHQGRIVVAETQTYSHGAVGGWTTNDNIVWTAVNDTDTLSSSTRSVFALENPSRYSAAHSMTANELFMVKTFGGAVRVVGDLDSPEVINMPQVASGYPCVPAATPIGVAYLGASGGVYLWNGGDDSRHVSRQLEDWFFKPSGSVLLDHQGVLAMIGTDFLALPRLWLMDVHSGGWWRLDDESNLRQHAWTMQSGFAAGRPPFIYAAMIEFNATNVPVVYGWDASIPARSYSWQSHPMWTTIDRYTEVRELIVEAIGTGTVTISITGRTGTQTRTLTFASNTVVDRQRVDFSCIGENLVVRIEAAGSSVPAPTVYGVHLGHYPHSSVVKG